MTKAYLMNVNEDTCPHAQGRICSTSVWPH